MVIIPRLLTVIAQHTQLRRQFVVIGRDHAAVAEAAQVLRRIEAEGTQRAQRTGPPAAILGADRLASVFDDGNAAGRGRDLPDLVHLGTLAEEMHRNDRLRGRRQLVQHVGRIEIKRFGQDIGKHRFGAQPPHGAGGRKERKARHDHLVARPDAQRQQRQARVASLPEAQPTACFDPQYSAIAASNRAQAGPCTKAPESQTSDNAASTSPTQLARFRGLHRAWEPGSIAATLSRLAWFNPQRGNDLRAAEVSAIVAHRSTSSRRSACNRQSAAK